MNLYSTGNELSIDCDYEAHLESCAGLVHGETDSLFSPMSAMRGIEYFFVEPDRKLMHQPFTHDPKRLETVGQFCDVYNSYSLGLTSYFSADGSQPILDERNRIYGKPLLSHEIGIHGTYIDLSLEERYKGSRIGDTELISSVRRHLADKGLLHRANTYFRNSCAWQGLLRKHCFETVRRCETFAEYDFLGDIDSHEHTFGYCVGMMNEFYELKPGETVDNVRRYNSDTVLLADLPACINYEAGARVEIPILVSHYGRDIPKALLQIHISDGGRVFYRKELRLGEIPRGAITELHKVAFRMPTCEKPMALTLTAQLSGGDTDCENRWDLYVFPKTVAPSAKLLKEGHVAVMDACNGRTLWEALEAGKNVILLGTGPFAWSEVSWQIAFAGRTTGHLATVIADHPLLENFPHKGFCGWPFAGMLNHGKSVVLEVDGLAHDPIIDIATSYKNARREAMMAEYRVGRGKLLICSLDLSETDPVARWLKNRILSYKGDFSDAKTIPEETHILAAGCRKNRVGISPKEWLGERVMYERIPQPARPRISDDMHCRRTEGYVGRSVMWWVQKRLMAYGVLISAEVTNASAEPCPVAAMQTYHVLRTVDMLKEYLHKGEVSLYCDGQEGVYGIVARYLAGIEREYGDHLLCNVEKQILSQNPLVYDNTLCYVIPGMLQHFDYDELM